MKPGRAMFTKRELEGLFCAINSVLAGPEGEGDCATIKHADLDSAYQKLREVNRKMAALKKSFLSLANDYAYYLCTSDQEEELPTTKSAWRKINAARKRLGWKEGA